MLRGLYEKLLNKRDNGSSFYGIYCLKWIILKFSDLSNEVFVQNYEVSFQILRLWQNF